MSIRIEPGTVSIVYPPHAGEDFGPCMEYPGSCSCVDCNILHSFARKICPVCGEPMGYGNEVPVRQPDQSYTVIVNGESVWIYGSNGEPLPIHMACYLSAREVSDAKTDGA